MGEEPVFFKDWAEVARIATLALTAYVGFIIILRISGKRTLAKMNVFDFVFVVALGSTLAHTIVYPTSTLAGGLTALTVLIILQIMFSWVQTKSKSIEEFINGVPTLLMFKGEFLRENMRKQRVTEEELRASIRVQGVGSLEAVHAIVMETDGAFSVVYKHLENPDSVLCDVDPGQGRH
jgi:uncharacterized membrane protein YcaP (DUF421 family)